MERSRRDKSNAVLRIKTGPAVFEIEWDKFPSPERNWRQHRIELRRIAWLHGPWFHGSWALHECAPVVLQYSLSEDLVQILVRWFIFYTTWQVPYVEHWNKSNFKRKKTLVGPMFQSSLLLLIVLIFVYMYLYLSFWTKIAIIPRDKSEGIYKKWYLELV